MIQKVVSPVVIGRAEQLDHLEDALLAANRCESRFVVLSGEAGIGKSRLAGELEQRAHKLGTTVLWGSCSEAELSLPYLPILEALGNYLALQDSEVLADRLGPAARELAQLFPQLGAPTASPTADPIQTKLRLFESMISLLAIPADDTGVLLVIEDIHWADASTRELLDYLARRLRGLRIMVLATYRNDELHRRHPLLPMIQGWRRAGFADILQLHEISEDEVGDIISAIFDTDDLRGDFMHAMYERSEGNPFVLEEMLKDSLDRGDVYRTDSGWERRSLEELRLPDSVRDTILMRLQRLSDEEVAVLQVASVLGRSFDYTTLAGVADLEEAIIHTQLEAAIREQLVEEDPAAPARYRFRHALTQEAIYNDMVMPRRNRIHSRAADLLGGRPGGAVEIAHHLLGARRFEDAVPVCIRGAEQAERAYAYTEAFKLYEFALEHASDPRLEAELPCRMGKALWFDNQPVQADAYLTEGIAGLQALEEETLAAHFLIVRGRCRWELSLPDLAAEDYERARAILEPLGPSADLALAYLRISGLHAFDLDGEKAHTAAKKAIDFAAQVGDTQTHAWALGFLGLAQVDLGEIEEGLANLDVAYREASAAGHMYVATNTAYNDLWTRVQLMLPVDDRLARIERLREQAAGSFILGSVYLSQSYVYNARGEVHRALDSAKKCLELFESLEASKYAWRCNLLLSEALAENNAVDDALQHLPDISERAEVQDIIYDSPARIRCLMAKENTARLAEVGYSILGAADSLKLYQVTLSLGVEAFVEAELIDEASRLLDRQRLSAHQGIGEPFIDRSTALVALARGRLDEVVEPARRAITAFARVGYKPQELRTRLALARALAGRGDSVVALNEISVVVKAARAREARLIESVASQAAADLGLVLELEPEDSPTDRTVEVGAGERLVTVMFADVRGYTAMSSERTPRDIAERIASLQQWAAREIHHHGGIVDKFAGDAVMATFNVSGARIDHAEHAMEAAIALQDKAALMDLGLGVGLASGSAIVGTFAAASNMSVIGETTNLAARLQAQAQAGEVLLSAGAFTRLTGWLDAKGLPVSAEELSLKGFDAPVRAYRVTRPEYAGGTLARARVPGRR